MFSYHINMHLLAATGPTVELHQTRPALDIGHGDSCFLQINSPVGEMLQLQTVFIQLQQPQEQRLPYLHTLRPKVWTDCTGPEAGSDTA